MNDEITPGGVWTSFWRWAGTALGISVITVILVSAVIFVGWNVGWWFNSQNVNRDTKLQEHSFSYQQAAIDRAEQDYTNALQSGGGTAAAWAGEACNALSLVDHPPIQLAQWGRRNCFAGALSPSSHYFIGGSK